MLTTPNEFSIYQGGTGIYRPTAVSNALLLAESKAEEWLSTPLTPTQFTEEFPWPVDEGKVMLRRVRLISIDTVAGYYWIDPTTCKWHTEPNNLNCAMIFNARQSIVTIVEKGISGGSICCGAYRACPARIAVTYTAGFTTAQSDPTTPDGMLMRAAIFEAAVGFLQSSIGLNSTGDVFIPGFNIAGYSEQRQLPEQSGADLLINQHIVNAKNLLRKLTVKQPISLRNRWKVLPY